jgi:transposase
MPSMAARASRVLPHWSSRRSGALTNKRRDRIKLLLWDRTGFWLLLKRLQSDRFVWPRDVAVMELTVEQLHWLLDGIDLTTALPDAKSADDYDALLPWRMGKGNRDITP